MRMLGPVEERRRADVRDEVTEAATALADAHLEAADGDADRAMLRLAKLATLLKAEVDLYRRGGMTEQLARVFEDQRRQIA